MVKLPVEFRINASIKTFTETVSDSEGDESDGHVKKHQESSQHCNSFVRLMVSTAVADANTNLLREKNTAE
jgi:capsular polysaccharide biosynthesis protein